jgi:vesicle-associated membrane protein-associated protein A
MEKGAHSLKVSPESALQFLLTRNDDKNSDGTSRCTMTLTHPGGNNDYISFKVKTTQPRRYLVRPNQGIVAPGTSETVNIVLVEKDKQMLLQSFDRLGHHALDNSKDKFLVQSCVTGDEAFAKQFLKGRANLKDDNSPEALKAGKELTEELTAKWNHAASAAEDYQIYNQKLHVKHVVPDAPKEDANSAAGLSSTATSRGIQLSDKTSLENMKPEQMFLEISSLRRKYDELVTFSVNLTAERDITNNTLEQTKRELNKEIAKSQRNAKMDTTAATSNAKQAGGISLGTFFVLAVLIFLVSAKLALSGKIGFLLEAPILGDLMKMEL